MLGCGALLGAAVALFVLVVHASVYSGMQWIIYLHGKGKMRAS